MDILSHGLYGGLAFGRKSRKTYWLAFLFGALPDLFAFVPFFTSMAFSDRSLQLLREEPHTLIAPDWVYMLYQYSHSLVIFAIIFGLVWLWRKKLPLVMLAWPLHILVDIPTHSTEFFPTPYLWPLTTPHINGIPWSHPAIFLPNVLFLVVLYTYWFLRKNSPCVYSKNKHN